MVYRRLGLEAALLLLAYPTEIDTHLRHSFVKGSEMCIHLVVAKRYKYLSPEATLPPRQWCIGDWAFSLETAQE